MKKVISYFIKYPVAVNIVILAFVVLGAMGAYSLKSSFFPLTKTKVITVQVFYPGASPQEMEEGVVLKIEDNLKGLLGIERVTSVSNENAASIYVEIIKGYDIDVLLADVKNAVNKVPNFPSGMEPPVIAKNDRIRETVSFVVTGEGISLKSLKEAARAIEDDLRRMEGVSQVGLNGFPAEEIEIAVREDDLRTYNISFQEVANAVSKDKLLTSGGTVKTQAEEYLIRARNRAYYAEDMSDLVLRADASGRLIRLKDVATVSDKWNESPNRRYYNGN